MINSLSLKKNIFPTLYVATFLVAFHIFMVVYINSSFLNQFISEKTVGILYIIGSLATIVILIIIPTILRLFGNYITLVIFTVFEILILFSMAFVTKMFILLPIFTAHLVISQAILINIDIFFESLQEREVNTGSRRGIIMTIVNSALILSILFVSFVLKDSEFSKVYMISAMILIPFLFIILIKFRKFKDPIYENFKILDTIKKISASNPVRNIFMAQVFLKFFFSLMVVYMPIYLYNYIGFDWQKIFIIFTIMLLPFVLIEIPAGKIADKRLGEKELLSAGFIIMAVFTIAISFISIPSFLIWTTILFATRIGASLVEITTESYFFKHVKGKDANIISFFRMTSPIAYIVGPIVAILALQFISFQYTFLVLGIIMLFGLKYSFALKDTK